MATDSVTGISCILNPFVTGPIVDCCQADTRFLRCEFTLPLRGIFQRDVTVANDSSVNCTLTTWHDTANVDSMTAKQVHSEVEDPGSYAVLCDLVKNAGLSSTVVVDDTLLWREMKKRLHKAAYNIIYKNVLSTCARITAPIRQKT